MAKIVDIFKCQCCDKIFYGKEYQDVDGLKYKTQEIREHICSDGIHGFGNKVGYHITEDENGL